MKKKLWYAVLKNREDNDWGYGSRDYDEAVEMLRRVSAGDGMIAVIDESGNEPMCIEEIHEADI